MDFGTLPDLANHFEAAADTVFPTMRDGAVNAYNAVANVWTGLTHPDAMPQAERNLQLMKLGSTGFGLYMAALGRNVHGAVGCSIAISETLLRLNRAGAKVRVMAP